MGLHKAGAHGCDGVPVVVDELGRRDRDRVEGGLRCLVGGPPLRSFVEKVFEHQPPRTPALSHRVFTDGQHVTWEYPRQSPDGDQMDIVEVMEITDGLIAHHRVYWGWKGVDVLIRDEDGR